jgi:hypothetical protein
MALATEIGRKLFAGFLKASDARDPRVASKRATCAQAQEFDDATCHAGSQL